MPKLDLKKIILTPAQTKFVLDNHKCTAFGGPFANGKTFASIVKVLRFTDRNPGCNFLICRKTFKQLELTTMPDFYEVVTPDMYIRRNDSDHFCIMNNGSTVYFINLQSAEGTPKVDYQSMKFG